MDAACLTQLRAIIAETAQKISQASTTLFSLTEAAVSLERRAADMRKQIEVLEQERASLDSRRALLQALVSKLDAPAK